MPLTRPQRGERRRAGLRRSPASVESWATTKAGTSSASRPCRSATSRSAAMRRRRPVARRRAAAPSDARRPRPPAELRRPRSRQSRHEPGEEAARAAARLAAARLAPLRPRQGEVDPGPGDPDVEQPPLLLERRVVVEGLADRQRALLEHRQEDRVPFEALRPVVRRELDADRRPRPRPHPRRRPAGRTRPAGRPARAPPTPPTRSSRIAASVSIAAARSRASAAPLPGVVLEAQLARPRRPDGGRAARRPSPTPRRSSGGRGRSRPGRPAAGRTRRPGRGNAIPARVSAASIGSSWAFVRTRTAISAGGVPPATQRPDPPDEPGELRVVRRVAA